MPNPNVASVFSKRVTPPPLHVHDDGCESGAVLGYRCKSGSVRCKRGPVRGHLDELEHCVVLNQPEHICRQSTSIIYHLAEVCIKQSTSIIYHLAEVRIKQSTSVIHHLPQVCIKQSTSIVSLVCATLQQLLLLLWTPSQRINDTIHPISTPIQRIDQYTNPTLEEIQQ